VNANLILAGILDAVKVGGTAGLIPAQASAIALGAVELYQTMRDQFGAAPDSLTNEQLASELQTRGIALHVDNDHWLAQHGFGPTV
jgi:hypothetical protein